AISKAGLCGLRRQCTTHKVTIAIIVTTVKTSRIVNQLVQPNSGSTGRGVPSTPGLATRADPIPLRALTPKSTATAAMASPAPSHDLFAGRTGSGLFLTCVFSVVTAYSSPVWSTRGDEMAGHHQAASRIAR